MNYLLLSFFFIIFQKFNYDEEKKINDYDQILENISKSLESYKSITYNYKRELYFPSVDILETLEGEVFFDFENDLKSPVPRIFIENKNTIVVFNGSERFDLFKDDKTMTVTPSPHYNELDALSFLYNSFITLKNGIKLIKENKLTYNLEETYFDDNKAISIQINLEKKYLNNFGEIMDLSNKGSVCYTFYFDYNKLIPLGVKQSNSFSEDYSITYFKNFIKNGDAPIPQKWFYSNYFPEYNIESNASRSEVKFGDRLPNSFKLFNPIKKKEIKEIDSRNSYSIFFFWISKCGYCRDSFSKMEKLKSQISEISINSEIYGVNPYENDIVIEKFYEQYNPSFGLFSDKSRFAKSLGIFRYPYIVITSNDGLVIYSGAFDESRILSSLTQ